MPANRKNELAEAMYNYYCKGHSLREVSEKFNRSNQSIHMMFKRRGWELRQQQEAPRKQFRGKQYSLKPSGYYVATSRSRTLMHRDVWEYHHGAIPDGYQVHHKDGNRGNNKITNLMLVEAREHSRRHMKAKMHLHVCPHCGGNLFPDG